MNMVGGIPTPLKNMNVNWDEIPNIWKNKNMFQTTNQIGACEWNFGGLLGEEVPGSWIFC